MKTVRLRPTFSIAVVADATSLLHQIQSAVANQPNEFQGQFRSHQGVISIAESKRHFWSPWLNVDIRKNETGTVLFGRYSPHPAIWTAFAFGYLTIGIVTFFSLIVGCSQQLANEFAWGYSVAPVCLVIGLLLWIFSQIGQRLAEAEMKTMNLLIDTTVARFNHSVSE